MRQLTLLLVLFSLPTFAIPTLTDLDKGEVETVTKDFGSNFVHTSVTPASSLARWGMEVGAFVGVTTSPGLNGLVQEEVGYLPHANLSLIFFMPWGFGLEVTGVPPVGYEGLTFKNTSGAVRWTLSEAFAPGGFIAVQILGHYGQANIDYEQEVSGADIEVGFASDSYGGGGKVSLQDIPYFEPYAYAGVVTIKANLKAKGTVSIFNTDFTQEDEVEAQQNGLHLAAGFQLKLPYSAIAIEYSRIIDNSRVSLKLALRFPDKKK
jgi:hypothetical protein